MVFPFFFPHPVSYFKILCNLYFFLHKASFLTFANAPFVFVVDTASLVSVLLPFFFSHDIFICLPFCYFLTGKKTKNCELEQGREREKRGIFRQSVIMLDSRHFLLMLIWSVAKSENWNFGKLCFFCTSVDLSLGSMHPY